MVVVTGAEIHPTELLPTKVYTVLEVGVITTELLK
jgi:hypothetical protein